MQPIKDYLSIIQRDYIIPNRLRTPHCLTLSKWHGTKNEVAK